MQNDMPQMMNCTYSSSTIPYADDFSNRSGSSFKSFELPQEMIIPKIKEIYMKRLIQVAIIDPDKKVPIEDSVLFMDEKPKLTDLNDQELYFEISLKELLDKHNAKREGIEIEEDDEGKTKKRKLKAIKIRDLRMVVIEIAKF